MNNKNVPINLRNSPDMNASVVASLGSGVFAVITHLGERWIYIQQNNQRRVVHKNVFTTGYSRLFKKWKIKTDKLEQYTQLSKKLLPVFITFNVIIWLLYLVLRSHYKRKRLKNSTHATRVGPRNHVAEINPEHSQNRQFVAHDKPRLVRTKPNISSKQRNDYQKKIEAEFYRRIENEIDARYQNDIEQIRQSNVFLEQQYQETKRKAELFGIDLEDSKIDSLIKGRQFELFTAGIFDADDRTTIEDWTSDKGIKDGLFVKSNSNPDFTVSINQDGVKTNVAVECKFRSRFDPNKEGIPTFITFDTKVKMERYRNYQKNKQIPVYILLGVEGTANNPGKLFIVSIEDALFIKYDHLKYKKPQYATTKAKLKPYEASSNILVKSLLEGQHIIDDPVNYTSN